MNIKFSKSIKYICSLALLVVPAIIGGAAQAQVGTVGAPTVQYFNAEDLKSRQGLLTVSTKYQTLLELPDNITKIGGNHLEVLQISPKDPKDIENVLYLDGLNPGGETDLNLTVGGELYLFHVRVESKTTTGTRKYSVKTPEQFAAISQAQPSGPTPASNPIATNTMQGTPDWLEFSIAPKTLNTGDINLAYTLSNTGQNPITADASKLRVFYRDSGNAKNVLYKLNRQSTSASNVIVEPSKSQTGTILIPSSVGKLNEVTVQWAFVESKTRTTYVYEKTISFVQSIKPAQISPVVAKVATNTNDIVPLALNSQPTKIAVSNTAPTQPITVNSLFTVQIGGTYLQADQKRQLSPNIGVYWTFQSEDQKGANFEVFLENRGNSPIQTDLSLARMFVLNEDHELIATYALNAAKSVGKIMLEAGTNYSKSIRMDYDTQASSVEIVFELQIIENNTINLFQKHLMVYANQFLKYS